MDNNTIQIKEYIVSKFTVTRIIILILFFIILYIVTRLKFTINEIRDNWNVYECKFPYSVIGGYLAPSGIKGNAPNQDKVFYGMQGSKIHFDRCHKALYDAITAAKLAPMYASYGKELNQLKQQSYTLGSLLNLTKDIRKTIGTVLKKVLKFIFVVYYILVYVFQKIKLIMVKVQGVIDIILESFKTYFVFVHYLIFTILPTTLSWMMDMFTMQLTGLLYSVLFATDAVGLVKDVGKNSAKLVKGTGKVGKIGLSMIGKVIQESLKLFLERAKDYQDNASRAVDAGSAAKHMAKGKTRKETKAAAAAAAIAVKKAAANLAKQQTQAEKKASKAAYAAAVKAAADADIVHKKRALGPDFFDEFGKNKKPNKFMKGMGVGMSVISNVIDWAPVFVYFLFMYIVSSSKDLMKDITQFNGVGNLPFSPFPESVLFDKAGDPISSSDTSAGGLGADQSNAAGSILNLISIILIALKDEQKNDSCLLSDTKIELKDKIINIQDLVAGDIQCDGSIVRGIMKYKASLVDIYSYKGIRMTGSHYIYHNGKYIACSDIESPQSESIEKLYCPVTSNGIIKSINDNNESVKLADYNNSIAFSEWNYNTDKKLGNKDLLSKNQYVEHEYPPLFATNDILNNEDNIGEIKYKNHAEVKMYNYNGVIVSGNVLVYEDSWKRIWQTKAKRVDTDYEYLYNVLRKDHTIKIGEYLFKDYEEINL